MNRLINISNHPSAKWSDEQKKGWDSIIDIPFPNVPASFSRDDVFELCKKLIAQLVDLGMTAQTVDMGYSWEVGTASFPDETKVSLQGEFSLCNEMFQQFYGVDFLVFPVSERNVVETVNPDGSTAKKVIFKFVKWR